MQRNFNRPMLSKVAYSNDSSRYSDSIFFKTTGCFSSIKVFFYRKSIVFKQFFIYHLKPEEAELHNVYLAMISLDISTRVFTRNYEMYFFQLVLIRQFSPCRKSFYDKIWIEVPVTGNLMARTCHKVKTNGFLFLDFKLYFSKTTGCISSIKVSSDFPTC